MQFIFLVKIIGVLYNFLKYKLNTLFKCCCHFQNWDLDSLSGRKKEILIYKFLFRNSQKTSRSHLASAMGENPFPTEAGVKNKKMIYFHVCLLIWLSENFHISKNVFKYSINEKSIQLLKHYVC